MPDMEPADPDPGSYDTLVAGGVYFATQEHVLYIHRGWGLATGPVTCAEWRRLVATDVELELAEVFQAVNINRGDDERVCEPGRARWRPLPAGEHIHFAPAGIAWAFGKSYRGVPSDKGGRIARRLGQSPSLSQWLDYIDRDRALSPVEEWATPEDGAPIARAGSARCHRRRDKAPRLFRYQPACIWLYRSAAAEIADVEAGRMRLRAQPEAGRRAKALEIAARLGALVFDGPRYLAGTGQLPSPRRATCSITIA